MRLRALAVRLAPDAMRSEYPKLREDLVVSELVQGDETYYVIKDPITRKFFRLKSHEYFIARRLDGKTPIDEIQARFREEFDTAPSGPSIERFIERITDLCLVETGLPARDLARAQRQAGSEDRGLGRLLHLRLKAIDPDRLLSALAPRSRFFFTWQFVVLVSAITLVAVAITVYRWDAYAAQARDLFRPGTIPTFILVVAVVTTLHEFAHGLTCKYYGGEVHEIGFVLIYLVPAFYCNVSDAWLFKAKARRLWVSAAGTLFQLVIYGVAAVVWLVAGRGTWLGDACAITIAVAGLTALFNFNPLIKLDGYYLLSDYLEIPNLRRRAFAHLGSKVKGRFSHADRQVRVTTAREKRIYLVYGVLAGAYSLGLLVFVVFKLGSFILSIVR